MPNTSSYSINGKNVCTNKTCYANFMSPFSGKLIQDKAYILIEKDKQRHFGREKILEYLNDLKDMGFEFTYRTSYIKRDIRVYPTKKIQRDAYNKMLCAAIRYLWEGKYKQTKSDRFYLFVEKYFEIKEKNGLTKLESLCLAHNLVKEDLGGFMAFNGNHMWIRSCGDWCRIFSSLPTTESSMNNYCSVNNKPKIEAWKQ